MICKPFSLVSTIMEFDCWYRCELLTCKCGAMCLWQFEQTFWRAVAAVLASLLSCRPTWSHCKTGSKYFSELYSSHSASSPMRRILFFLASGTVTDANSISEDSKQGIFGSTKTSAFSTNAQPRFASVVLYGVLRPPCLACHNTGLCPCFSVVPEQRTRRG